MFLSPLFFFLPLSASFYLLTEPAQRREKKKKNRYCKQINKTSVMADDMSHEKTTHEKEERINPYQ
jgi:hypothetical protein